MYLKTAGVPMPCPWNMFMWETYSFTREQEAQRGPHEFIPFCKVEVNTLVYYGLTMVMVVWLCCQDLP